MDPTTCLIDLADLISLVLCLTLERQALCLGHGQSAAAAAAGVVRGPALRCGYLCAHTTRSQKAGPFSVARLKMDLPLHNRLAFITMRCITTHQHKMGRINTNINIATLTATQNGPESPRAV